MYPKRHQFCSAARRSPFPQDVTNTFGVQFPLFGTANEDQLVEEPSVAQPGDEFPKLTPYLTLADGTGFAETALRLVSSSRDQLTSFYLFSTNNPVSPATAEALNLLLAVDSLVVLYPEGLFGPAGQYRLTDKTQLGDLDGRLEILLTLVAQPMALKQTDPIVEEPQVYSPYLTGKDFDLQLMLPSPQDNVKMDRVELFDQVTMNELGSLTLLMCIPRERGPIQAALLGLNERDEVLASDFTIAGHVMLQSHPAFVRQITYDSMGAVSRGMDFLRVHIVLQPV